MQGVLKGPLRSDNNRATKVNINKKCWLHKRGARDSVAWTRDSRHYNPVPCIEQQDTLALDRKAFPVVAHWTEKSAVCSTCENWGREQVHGRECFLIPQEFSMHVKAPMFHWPHIYRCWRHALPSPIFQALLISIRCHLSFHVSFLAAPKHLSSKNNQSSWGCRGYVVCAMMTPIQRLRGLS